MRIPFRKKTRWEKARAAVRDVIGQVRERFEDREEAIHHPRQRRRAGRSRRPVLRIIIKD